MKIVVPIMPRSLEEVEQLDVSRYRSADIVEWRADFLPQEEILHVAPAIFEKFAGQEIMFTLRTHALGGHIALSDADYVDLIKQIQHLYQPDYIDFEYYLHKDVFEDLLSFSNLVLSYYNLDGTPENLMEIISELTSLMPKVVKITTTPHSVQDVLDLMNYTHAFKVLNPEQAFATRSRGDLGRRTHLISDLTGSDWVYAYVNESTAPELLSLSNLKKIQEILDED